MRLEKSLLILTKIKSSLEYKSKGKTSTSSALPLYIFLLLILLLLLLLLLSLSLIDSLLQYHNISQYGSINLEQLVYQQ